MLVQVGLWAQDETANVGYRFSKLFQTTLGYRFIEMDYASGAGSDRFTYDVITSGPVIRLEFNL